MRIILLTVLFCLGAFSVVDAKASPITFRFIYSGASFGNTAVGLGSVTFESSLLPNPTLGVIMYRKEQILDYSLTVYGASTGNGVFGRDSLWYMNWGTGKSVLDLSKELVGQPTEYGPWGSSSLNFNLFSDMEAPSAATAHLVGTSGGFGDLMELVSVRAVPLPSAVWLLGSSLLVLTGIVRKPLRLQRT